MGVANPGGSAAVSFSEYYLDQSGITLDTAPMVDYSDSGCRSWLVGTSRKRVALLKTSRNIAAAPSMETMWGTPPSSVFSVSPLAISMP